MSRKKKTILLFAAVLALLFALKGVIYRGLFHYEIKATKAQTLPSDLLVFDETFPTQMTLEEFTSLVTELTSSNLSFTSNKCSTYPAIALKEGKTNCVGYSATFSAIAQQIIKQNGWQDQFEVKHHIAHIHLFEWNVHDWFDDSFYKDHDINSVKDLKTGEMLYIDPSLNDYTGINSVKLKE